MSLRRLVTIPVRRLLQSAGYDVVRIAPALSDGSTELPAIGPLATNPILHRIFTEGVVEDAEGNPVGDAKMSAVQLLDATTLYDLIRKYRPQRTLEIGMAYATTTLLICEALRENGGGHHTVMDPFQHSSYKDIGLLNIRRAGFEAMVDFYDEESYKVLPRLLAEGRQYDFVFIDGDHLFDSVFLDFYFADKMLRQGGLVLFHDMDMPSVRKAVSFVLHNKPYVLSVDCHGTPPTKSTRFTRFLHNVAHNPLEPHIWPFHSLRAPFLTGLVRKIDDDHRLWTHYAPF